MANGKKEISPKQKAALAKGRKTAANNRKATNGNGANGKRNGTARRAMPAAHQEAALDAALRDARRG